MNPNRLRIIRSGREKTGPVIYWMSREQRTDRNWALLYSQDLAIEKHSPLLVIFCLVPWFLGAQLRHYLFMIKGLQEVEDSLVRKNISFFLLTGTPEEEIPRFIEKVGAGALVTDFDPLRIKRHWKKIVSDRSSVPFYEVDAHNIVPCWVVSNKQEWAAYTFRPKIRLLLPDYMDEFPRLKRHPFSWSGRKPCNDWKSSVSRLKVESSAPRIDWISPGTRAARKVLSSFLKKKIHGYNERRNDPNAGIQSDLSPYLHFGHISAQEVAMKTSEYPVNHEVREAFLEELIVRRELSDNFCYYNGKYDQIGGFPAWARDTLKKHRGDHREHLYSLDQFEAAHTDDELWNAAQREMVKRGKMHGYMRMYWAKKILEWTDSPEQALEWAVYLNDRYQLDGRDPNGYTGIAWSIGGVHDRAWKERPVFGKIRYMSYGGSAAKFDAAAYIKKYL